MWGVSTSSYQIEGAYQEDGKCPSIWDTWAHDPKHGVTENGDECCDHYHHWEQDVNLLKELGVKAYRFSISWPRVMRSDFTPNEKGLQFYSKLIDALIHASKYTFDSALSNSC